MPSSNNKSDLDCGSGSSSGFGTVQLRRRGGRNHQILPLNRRKPEQVGYESFNLRVAARRSSNSADLKTARKDAEQRRARRRSVVLLLGFAQLGVWQQSGVALGRVV